MSRLADVLELQLDPARSILLHTLRHKCRRVGRSFPGEQRSHAIAKDVVVLLDDVADVDADPKIEKLRWARTDFVGHRGHLPATRSALASTE